MELKIASTSKHKLLLLSMALMGILDNVVIIPVEIMQYRDQCQLLNKQTDYPLHVEVE